MLSPLRESSSPHLQHLPHRIVHPNYLPGEKVSAHFVASAAPAAVDGSVADKLPADLQFTETPELNSRLGDVVILDISATTIEQDESTPKTIPSAESKEDGDRVLPKFSNSITGMKRGETKSFPYVFPDSWKQDDLHGVSAQFTVECKELFHKDLPELNDSLADKILNGCTTIEEVKRTLLEKSLELERTAK